MKRGDVLDQAGAIVSKDRNTTYGEPEDLFGIIADMWTAYAGNMKFAPSDVAIFLAMVKIARLRHNPGHEDSWVDLAGYAACGAEVATTGRASAS